MTDAGDPPGGPPSDWPASPAGEEAFAELLARREDSESVDLEAFCAERPEVAGEVRALWATWTRWAGVLAAVGGPAERGGAAADDASAERARGGGGPGPAAELLPPTPDGSGARYRVEGELGRGAMGVVHRVWDAQLHRRIAMKVIRTPVLGRIDRRRARRFLEEARITGQLGHPGIVPIHELGVDSRGRLYFTMPLVEGHTLSEIFRLARKGEGGWSTPRVLGVLQRVCEAMAFAHSRGVVHRDLKPANVMVGRFGETYVMDWGLARLLDAVGGEGAAAGAGPDGSESSGGGDPEEGAVAAEVAFLTREGDVVGTPAYMPPEQAAGRHAELGAAADVYALGAMLYELLAGGRPYAERPSSTAAEVLAHVRSGPPRPLSGVRPAPPAELVAICEKAMARRPEDRYPDIRRMADDLRAFLEGRVVGAYESGGWAEFKKWIRRNRALAGSFGGLIVVSLVGLAAVAWVEAVEKAKVLRLADFQLLSEYRAEAEGLWPAVPERVPALEGWLGRARALLARLPLHEERLAQLRARAARHPGGGAALFDDPEERWQYEKLVELVDGLRAFGHGAGEAEGAGGGPPGRVADVERRLAAARTLRERSIEAHAAAWDEVARARPDPERAPAYGGLELEPQLGLVPLGPDPESGLFEFAHLASGASPARGPDGALVLGRESGLVLVLLPGGRFTMGADRARDPHATDLEEPAHAVTLAPFFLAKHETTQAQWERATGRDPSAEAGATPPSELRPVENVTWLEARRVLRQLDLALPTEAQWEYAARAGTTGAWWTGARPGALAAAEAIDGYGTLAVGGRRANPFGLHDVLGNVMEWCRDRYDEYRPGAALAARNGERPGPEHAPRVLRGGHCAALPDEARVTVRRYKAEGDRHVFLGVRAARAVRGAPTGP